MGDANRIANGHRIRIIHRQAGDRHICIEDGVLIDGIRVDGKHHVHIGAKSHTIEPIYGGRPIDFRSEVAVGAIPVTTRSRKDHDGFGN